MNIRKELKYISPPKGGFVNLFDYCYQGTYSISDAHFVVGNGYVSYLPFGASNFSMNFG